MNAARLSVVMLAGLALNAVALDPGARAAAEMAAPARGDLTTGAGTIAAATAAVDTNATVITSTRLNFDQQKRQAVFTENVVVTDREIKILADCLKVFFTEDNKVDRLEAEGNVSIIRNDLTATGDRATYDLKESKMQLTGNPLIRREQDQLTGKTITLWRNSRRILCEPNARLVITSEQGLGRTRKE